MRGFGIFLACIALGVTTIVGVLALGQSLAGGLASQSRALLGGDLAVSRMHRAADPDELGLFARLGTLSEARGMRAMALTDAGAILVDLKAVDGTYPSVGRITSEPPTRLPDLFATVDGIPGALADQALFDRLGLVPGSTIRIGDLTLRLAGVLTSEPDRLGSGLTLGPRVLMDLDSLAATGLVQPGSLIRYTYRLLLPPQKADDQAVKQAVEGLTNALADHGFEIRSRLNASPQLTRNIERFTQFLVIIALTALITGGIGVASAVTGYVDRQRKTMAIMKALGASGSVVFATAFAEIMSLALLGVITGVVLGSALPFAVSALIGPLLPTALEPKIYPLDGLAGALYGLLVAAAFSLIPLGHAHDTPVAILFRNDASAGRRWPRPRYIVSLALVILALAASITMFAPDRRIALMAVVGTAAIFGFLHLFSVIFIRVTRRIPHSNHITLRLAIGNLHRSGAPTRAVIPAMGLGLALITLLAIVEATLGSQLQRGLPKHAPSFFFVDIGGRDITRFETFISTQVPEADLHRVPMLRGRITEIKDTPSERAHISEDASWVLDGDRGVTFAESLPEGSSLVEGSWWGASYAGPPLVSIEAGVARGLGLAVGDEIAVNVLGRTIKAHIANLRRVDWQSLGINFVLVFSPNAFAGAPVSYLATLTMPPGANRDVEAQLVSASARSFPAVSVIRVKEVLETLKDLVGKLALSIKGTSAVTVLAVILVLAGAVGSGQRARIHDAVVLKILGATRRRLIVAYALEFSVLALVAAAFGVILGGAAAWVLSTFGLDLAPAVPTTTIAIAVILAIALALVLGLTGTAHVLSQRTGAFLKTD